MALQNLDWNSFTNSTIFIEHQLSVKQVVEIKRPINHNVCPRKLRVVERQICKQLQLKIVCPIF